MNDIKINNGYYDNTSIPASVPVTLDDMGALDSRGTLEQQAYVVVTAKQLRALARIATAREKAAGINPGCCIIRGIKLHTFGRGDIQISSADITLGDNVKAVYSHRRLPLPGSTAAVTPR